MRKLEEITKAFREIKELNLQNDTTNKINLYSVLELVKEANNSYEEGMNEIKSTVSDKLGCYYTDVWSGIKKDILLLKVAFNIEKNDFENRVELDFTKKGDEISWIKKENDNYYSAAAAKILLPHLEHCFEIINNLSGYISSPSTDLSIFNSCFKFKIGHNISSKNTSHDVCELKYVDLGDTLFKIKFSENLEPSIPISNIENLSKYFTPTIIKDFLKQTYVSKEILPRWLCERKEKNKADAKVEPDIKSILSQVPSNEGYLQEILQKYAISDDKKSKR